MKLNILASVTFNNGTVSVKKITFDIDPNNQYHVDMYNMYKETGDYYYISKLLPEDYFGDNDFYIVSIQEN